MLARIRARLGAAFWGRALVGGELRSWMHEDVCRRYINESVTGDPNRWPLEWLRAYLGDRRLAHGVSLGCGTGALERDLIAKGICARVTGLDLSRRALARARQLAREAGREEIVYEEQDLNRLRLPAGAYDGAFFHQALHHVEDLDTCLGAVREALTPDGLLYLDEYVGPSRHDWPREDLRAAAAEFESIPAPLRRRRRLPPPVDWRDPTEAIRSSEILGAVDRYFEIREQRDYGGNFLAVICPHLALDRCPAAERRALLERIVAAERSHLAAGNRSFYSVIVAAPRVLAPGG